MQLLASQLVGGMALFALAMPAYAQETSQSDAQLLAQAFVGHCVQNAGRTDKVEAAARLFGYRELDGDMKAMLAPQNPDSEYSGWFVKEEGYPPYLLGISSAQLKGDAYQICVVSNPDVPMDDVLEETRLLVSFGRVLDDSEEAGQRYRVWETEQIASRSFVSAVDAPKMGVLGGTLSLTVPKEQ